MAEQTEVFLLSNEEKLRRMRFEGDGPPALVEGDDEVFKDVLAEQIEVRGQMRRETDFGFVPGGTDFNRNDVGIERDIASVADHGVAHLSLGVLNP